MPFALTLGTVSFFIAVIWGRPLIALLKRYGVGKQIRIEQPDRHQFKTGTPTMGGVLMVVPVLLITGALNVANLVGLNAIGQSTLLLFFCLDPTPSWARSMTGRASRASAAGAKG
ncbi:MAG: hypothetical protein R3A10_11070 [Caldilineaceae bacterium]